jgi:hypothetical protein
VVGLVDRREPDAGGLRLEAVAEVDDALLEELHPVGEVEVDVGGPEGELERGEGGVDRRTSEVVE